MKKILFVTLASVLALASCAKFEHDSEYTAVKTGSPVISDATYSTDSLSAKVTPADGNTTFYSYALLAGTGHDIDAATLLSDGIKDAIVSNCVNADVIPSVTVIVNKLSEGETYTLYAVATTKTGTVSAVSSQKFILKDDVNPSFDVDEVEYDLTDSVLTVAIPFDRNIKFAENAKVTVRGWGILDSRTTTIQGYDFLDTPLCEKTLEGDQLSIEDNVLYVQMPKEDYSPGLIVTFTFAEGTVLSLPVSEGAEAGLPCEAYEDEYIEYGEGILEAVGFQYPNEVLQLTVSENNPKYIRCDEGRWEKEIFRIAVDDSVAVYTEGNAKASYTTSETGYSTVRTADMNEKYGNVSFSEFGDTIIFTLPVEPQPMEYVGFTVPAESFYDIFGNTNEELTVDPVLAVEGELDIKLENVKAGCNNFTVDVVPGAKGLYFCVDYNKETIEPASAEEELVDAILTYMTKLKIQTYADAKDISFAEAYLDAFAWNSEDTYSEINLEAETTYMIYAFYMTAEGTVLSPVFKEIVETEKFEFPTETTGTFTYATSPFKALGAQPGIPVSINATKDTITISNFGTNGVDLKCAVDKSGNMKVVLTPVMKHATYGVVYANEIEDWYQVFYEKEWGSRSYYDSVEKTIYFNIVYHIASGGYFGVGQYADTFHFDNSQPAPAPSAVSNVANVKSVSVSKINAPRRRHVR